MHPPKKLILATTTTTKPSVSTAKPQAPKSSQATSQTQWQRVLDVKKKTPTHPDRTLERLEALHKNTNVQDNLKLTEGQRIKLEPVPNVKKRKRKAAPDPEIKFADIGDSQPLQDVCRDISYHLDDDDDLPEAHELMTSAPRKHAPSSDDLADSDIDALIRDFPDDNDFGARPASPLNTRFSPNPVPKRMKLSDESPKVGSISFLLILSMKYVRRRFSKVPFLSMPQTLTMRSLSLMMMNRSKLRASKMTTTTSPWTLVALTSYLLRQT